MKSVLLVSRNEEACEAIKKSFSADYRVKVVGDPAVAFELAQERRHEFIFVEVTFLCEAAEETDYRTYRKGPQQLWRTYPGTQVIVLSPHTKIREAVKAVKAGASDYLTYPIDPEEVKYIAECVYEALRRETELDYLRDEFWQQDTFERVQTRSSRMNEVLRKVRSVAPTISTVLLTGETGTGKGVLARLIHRHSNRPDKPFIAVHCGAIPDTLLESELFGHEKGAFTGAERRKLGKFEVARQGTIFLDEIGAVTPAVQIKLLQVLQEKSFQRVGAEEAIESNVRIISATNEDLSARCDQGAFRRDLFYRLNVFPIELPPLRERIEDLPLLVDVFLSRLNQLYGKDINDVQPQVMDAFEQYAWPGNIRELENLVERAYIIATSRTLTQESFPRELFLHGEKPAPLPLDTSLPLAEFREHVVENAECQYLKDLLSRYKGRINRTAEAAGIGVRQLNNLMTRHGLYKEDFKDA